jgi:ornithine decarboxylase
MSIDNQLLERYNVQLYSNESTTYDIINDFVKNNQDEHPFYIIDIGEIIKAYEKWTTHFPNIKPYYAVKCNPNPVLLRALNCLGTYFDCASENEIKSILELTNDPNKIIFANPCKMSSQIKYARANNVDLMTFDCEEELYKIKLYHPFAKLILRLAVDDSKSVCKFNCKFGCKLEKVEFLINIMNTLELQLVGFSFHVGSGCKSVESYYTAIRTCRNAHDIAIKNNMNISIIDVGGGFPGIYFDDDPVNIKHIADTINKAQRDFFNDEIIENKIHFISEPGRYFVEKSHTLILNVIGKKRELDVNNDINKWGEGDKCDESMVYYLNDGVYGSFNCIYFDHKIPSIIPLNERNDKNLYKSRIFGPTCDSIDLITDGTMLPELSIGEWVYVENFGAYTTAASSAFNGFVTTDYKYILRT